MPVNRDSYKIAFVSPVPFNYHVPIYRKIAGAVGIDLTVYYCSTWAPLPGKNYDDPALLEGYKSKFLKNYSLHPSLEHWPFGLINFGIWSEIKNNKYDAVILQSWNNLTFWLAFLACLKFKTSVFFMTDTNILSESPGITAKKVFKKILFGKFFFKKATGFLTSGGANRIFLKYYGASEKKMVNMPYSWGYEYFLHEAEQLKSRREKIRMSFGIKNNDFVFLFVGRLSFEKDLMVLLDAYNNFIAKNKKLFIVGDGSLRNKIEQHIEKLKIKDVSMMGFQKREKLPEFYILADAFILPSYCETWGIVVNEAMCFGLPIIVSDHVGAAPDLVKDNYNGFIFPAGDRNGLFECMEKIIKMTVEDRNILGARSYDIITQWISNLDPLKQIRKILELSR